MPKETLNNTHNTHNRHKACDTHKMDTEVKMNLRTIHNSMHAEATMLNFKGISQHETEKEVYWRGHAS